MKDLVQIIKANPGCVAEIDNDYWSLKRTTTPPKDFDNLSDEAQEQWWRDQEIASSEDSDLVHRGEGYGSGNCYGGDILQALAEIVGIKVESV